MTIPTPHEREWDVSTGSRRIAIYTSGFQLAQTPVVAPG